MTSSPSQFAHRRPFWPLPSQIVASAFATDAYDGKSKRRGGNGRLMTGTFQIASPRPIVTVRVGSSPESSRPNRTAPALA